MDNKSVPPYSFMTGTASNLATLAQQNGRNVNHHIADKFGMYEACVVLRRIAEKRICYLVRKDLRYSPILLLA